MPLWMEQMDEDVRRHCATKRHPTLKGKYTQSDCSASCAVRDGNSDSHWLTREETGIDRNEDM